VRAEDEICNSTGTPAQNKHLGSALNMRNLLGRSAVVLIVIAISALFFAPNVTSQHLQVVFQEYYRLPDGTKKINDPAMIADFIRDRENGLKLFFPSATCVPEAQGRIPATHRCVLTSRFITSARINELSHANPGLIDEVKTSLLPDPIERFFKFMTKTGYKDLKIKLGLDLQGGMRATFKADYEKYLAKLKEKYEPVLVQLNEKLARADTPQADKDDAKIRIKNINTLLTLSEPRKQELLIAARTVIDKRLARQNLSEPEVHIQPESYSIGIDLPGVGNSSEVLQKIRETLTVEYRIVNDEATSKVNTPENLAELEKIQLMYREGRVDPVEVEEILKNVSKKAALGPADGKIFLYWRRGRNEASTSLPREFRVLGPVVLDGSDMTNAQENINPNTAWYRIDFILSGAGAEKFGEITTTNVNKRLAILWGDRVVSDPVIQSPIVGGNGVITGEFSQQEAADVAGVIREGALPLPLEILSVSFVGPSLGQESIIAGIVSILMGFLIVVVFIFGYYRLSGIPAIIALFLNLLITAAVLSLLEFTLTLPGFAGAILTVGMAIDANVIINEKMKEDLREGKVPSIAIESGFRSSFWTILDSHVTTIIASVIMWKVGEQFGDSAIMGFSITLFFGLVSSMFTSLYVAHLLFDWVQHFIPLKRMSIGFGFKKAVK